MAQKKLSELIPRVYREFWADSKKQNHLRYVLSGGRGSGKSTVVGFRFLMDIIEMPISGLVVRKVGNTLYESVYNQLQECALLMGVYHLFHWSKSPLQITYLPRGNKIIFRGADNPIKIKSIKVAKFPIGIMWVEELAEFMREDDIDVIEQSVLRGELPKGCEYKLYYSFNPPKRRNSWVNVKYGDSNSMIDSNTFKIHTTYLDNPYISKASIDEAERMKEKDYLRYEYVFLGKPVGNGIIPFPNLRIERISDEMIMNFDNIRNGLDFGFMTDPCSFTRLHYDKTRRIIYIFDELFRTQLFNHDIVNWIKAKKYDRDITIGDSAEPKSIAEIRASGVNIIGAKKGKDSVEYGEKFLQSLEGIVIDPIRCPNTAREFETIDFAQDNQGNYLPRLVDKDNHSIDSVRYALNNDMKATTWKVY